MQQAGIPELPSQHAPNHQRNAECRRAPLTPYLLPGERLLHLRPRRIICRSTPLRTRKSTTAAKCCSEVQAATLNRWMFTALRLCRCGGLHAFGTRFSPSVVPPRFFPFVQAGYWRRAALVSCRWMLEVVGERSGQDVVWLVGLFILSGTEDLESLDCCNVRVRSGDRWADAPLSGTVGRVCAWWLACC